MTNTQALKLAQSKLATVSDAPALDAERLLAHVLEKGEISWLYAHPEQELTNQQQLRFKKLVSERATGKPLAYTLESWEFYGREFIITEDVLIPRPSTEALVDKTLRHIDISICGGEKPLKPFVIADIGTGSGCIIISLVLELINFQCPISNFQYIATDISTRALKVAKKNAEKHGVIDQIEFLHGDMLEPLTGRHVDLIVSNPPYIPTNEIPDIHRHCEKGAKRLTKQSQLCFRHHPRTVAGLKFEPRIALDGGIDGQTFVHQIKQCGISSIIETTNGKIQLM